MGDLDIYGTTDQPTTCPKCGCRTEFEPVVDSDPPLEIHICLNTDCKFQFYTEDYEDDA